MTNVTMCKGAKMHSEVKYMRAAE